jgi:hypothetical protein
MSKYRDSLSNPKKLTSHLPPQKNSLIMASNYPILDLQNKAAFCTTSGSSIFTVSELDLSTVIPCNNISRVFNPSSNSLYPSNIGKRHICIYVTTSMHLRRQKHYMPVFVEGCNRGRHLSSSAVLQQMIIF